MHARLKKIEEQLQRPLQKSEAVNILVTLNKSNTKNYKKCLEHVMLLFKRIVYFKTLCGIMIWTRKGEYNTQVPILNTCSSVKEEVLAPTHSHWWVPSLHLI